MNSSDLHPLPAMPRAAMAGGTLRWLFTIAAFLNAVLLFGVEPMFAKLALPLLGGTPGVWNTALVFFQGTLLLGYGYAHVTARYCTPRTQLRIHAAVLALSCIALPLQLRVWGAPPTTNAAAFWLLGVMSISVGPLFFVLSSGAPLLQRWFSLSDDADAADPYFLYAASNLGSLCSLLSYPLLVEPLAGLSVQSRTWSVAYVVATLLVTICAFAAIRSGARTGNSGPRRAQQIADAETSPVSVRDRLRWIAYAAVPSSLLMGATSFVSNDIAALPLLWVLPLSLYLLSFVLVFARRSRVPHAWMVRVEPHFLIIAAIMFLWNGTLPGMYAIAFHFGLLFVVSMVCHGELAQGRPHSRHLTEFFLWISVGGFIGGVFNALIAPSIFNSVLEYPIAIALAALLRPAAQPSDDARVRRRARILDVLVPLLLVAASTTFARWHHATGESSVAPAALIAVCAVALVLLSSAQRPARFFLALGSVFLLGAWSPEASAGGVTLAASRSFFGVYRVIVPAGDSLTQLVHGTTVHGAQRRDVARRDDPLTYYARSGPVGDLFQFAPAARNANRRVGVVGLGTGSVSCYSKPGDRFTYYEIDPLVLQIARDTALFRYLHDCTPRAEFYLGDARLTLQQTADAAYDLFLLDAFSSDAIPVHLLTREAFALYDRVLAPKGILAVHISNKHLDLEPVLSTVARASGFQSLVRADLRLTPEQRALGQSPTVWVVLARSRDDFGALQTTGNWVALRSGGDLWLDNFTNVRRIIRWK